MSDLGRRTRWAAIARFGIDVDIPEISVDKPSFVKGMTMTDIKTDPRSDAGLQIQSVLENAILGAIEVARNEAGTPNEETRG